MWDSAVVHSITLIAELRSKCSNSTGLFVQQSLATRPLSGASFP